MRVLVTGGAGYVGTPVCLALCETHEVVCWDPGLFGFHADLERRVRVVPRRVQELTEVELRRLAPDWILHLAGLSNDPMADFAPRMNWVENVEATRHVGELAARSGVPLLFASSASVYGFSPGEPLDEGAPVRPIGHYSESKAAAEEWLRAHHPHAVILRQATVMGVSPRMRFDLLTNGMTRSAWRDGRLRVLYGGRETRPQVHVADLVALYRLVLDRRPPAGVYNVGASNDSVMTLAESIRERVARRAGRAVELEITDEPRQHRSYALSSAKVRAVLGWEPRLDVAATVDELCAALAEGRVDPEDPRAFNIRWLKLVCEAQGILGRTGPIEVEETPISKGPRIGVRSG